MNRVRWLLLLGLVLAIGFSLFAWMEKEYGQPKQAAWPNGEQVAVRGANARYPDLHSLDFIDADTGWVVAEDSNQPVTTSKVLRTQDGGAHWEQAAELDNTAVERLKFVDQTTGWAIAEDASQAASGIQTGSIKTDGVKILQTKDGGQNWQAQWDDQGANLPSGGDLWFQEATTGFALIGGRLLSTQDGGRDWTTVSFGLTDFAPEKMCFVDRATGWVIGVDSSQPSEPTRLAVLRTLDGGKSWQRQFEQDYPGGPAGGIDIDFVNATTGWFLTSNMATMTGDLYYTTDGGAHWQRINQIRCNRPSPTELQFINPRVGWIPLDMGAGPIDGGLLLTRDGGKSFTTLEGAGNNLHEVVFSSPEQGWAVGTALNYGDYLVRTSDGGQSWTQVFPGLRPTQDISFVDSEHGFGLGQLSDPGALLASADGGATWRQVYSFAPGYLPGMLSFVDGDTGWALATASDYDQTYSKTVALKTTDGGRSWTLLTSDVPPIYSFSMSYFRFFDADHGLIATVGQQVAFYRTQDGGRTWQISKQECPGGTCLFSFVTPEQGWQAYTLPRPTAVIMSRTKDGSTWQSLPQVGSDTQLLGLDFVSPDYGLLLVQEPPYSSNSRPSFLITTDGGQTWSAHPFPDSFRLDMELYQMPLQFADQQYGWILSQSGLLRTQDGGRTWTAE